MTTIANELTRFDDLGRCCQWHSACSENRSDCMNPFAILHALVTALEAVNPKRRQETKREQRRFLFWYFLFLFLAVAVVGSIIYELYFAK